MTQISPADLKTDLDLLVAALKAAHPAQWIMPIAEWSGVLKDLNNISEVQVEALAAEISRIFNRIPDGHLEVRSQTQRYGAPSRAVTTGENLAKGRAWALEWRGKIPILAVAWFPQPSEPEWDGFIEAVRTVRDCKVAIVDLRGNPGGNDFWAIEATAVLLDHEFHLDWVSEVFCESAIGSALQANTYSKIMWRRYANQGLPAPDPLLSLRDENIARSESLGSEPVKREVLAQQPAPAQQGPKAFHGHLYVLLDPMTRSSAEWMALYLKRIPGTVLVGEPSFGQLHFGNTGLLCLPHSQLEIVICEKINRLVDGQFYEKTGIPPDKIYRDGDSLDYLLHHVIDLRNPSR